MATYNIGMKVGRSVTAGMVVSSNGYAVADYKAGNAAWTPEYPVSTVQGSVIQRSFGPNQTIPNTFTTTYIFYTSSLSSVVSAQGTITWTLLSGYEIVNTI